MGLPARSRIPLVRTLERPRLSAKLEQSWQVPLTVVAAPAGSGKSWLLAGFARRDHGSARTVLWYEADRTTLDDLGLVRHLSELLPPSTEAGGSAPPSVQAFLDNLQRVDAEDVLLIVDDTHVLAGSRAADVLGQLVNGLPPWLHLVLSGRQPPALDLSRRRVGGDLLEIGPDDLRFRSWEVSDLFLRHHGHDLPPEEIAELARRTGGWAAGLHLFHLAIAGRPAAYRRQMLVSLPSRLRTCRDYLTENVLAGLEDDLRGFLIDSSVLGALSGSTCDTLLGRHDSAAVLEELAARHLFLTTTDAVTYRMHEVLRGHLEQLLVERSGEEAARLHCLRAARLLEGEGVLGEAWRAYCRAQDWESAGRLLACSGGELLDAPATWWEPVPAVVAGSDAWVLLARSRRQVLAGRWAQALDGFRQAEKLADVPRLARTCTEELMALEGWVEPRSMVLVGWSGALRQACTAGPGTVAPSAGAEPVDRLVDALVALLAGSPARAWELLAVGTGLASPALERWATLAAAVAARMLGRHGAGELAATAADALEASLPPWIMRLLQLLAGADAALVLQAAAAASEALADTRNPWAESLLGLVHGTASVFGGEDGSAAGELAARSLDLAQGLGSRTLEAWSTLLVAIAAQRSGSAEAEPALRAAERLGRSIGCSGVAFLAEELGSPPTSTRPHTNPPPGLRPADAAFWSRLAERLRPSAGERSRTGVDGTVRLRCFGDFELTLGGRRVDMSRAQPKVRSVLHLLAVNAGSVVHRDVLSASLWSANGDAATRNLQVAISSLRKFLDVLAGGRPAPDGDGSEAASLPLGGALISRRGDGYALELDSAEADVPRFKELLRSARAAGVAGREADAVAALAEALEAYRGDLLAGEGTADWLLEERELLRMRATDAAEELARRLLHAGDAAGALRAAVRGLEIDRYRDGLWRMAIAAHEAVGDVAAAARATADYARVLADLGVGPEPAGRLAAHR